MSRRSYWAGYQRELIRLDRQCKTGYACGNSCVSREKDCRINQPSAATKRISRLTGAGQAETALGKKLHGPPDEIHQLRLRRDALLNEGKELLSRRREDGSTLLEHPTPQAMRSIEALGRRIREVDRQILIAEGKNPERRRWQNGTPGLVEVSGAMAPPHPSTPGRQRFRQQLIDEALAEGSTKGKGEGGRPVALVMMGGPGSGKSTMMNKLMADKSGFVQVDPDGVKERLPEYQLAVANSDRTAAARAHEESSLIADEIRDRAISQGMNVILDGTGKNADKYEAMIRDLKARGYEVRLMMPHVTTEEGVKRVASRAERNGRFVPTEIVESAYNKIPRNFERLARLADYAALHDGMSTDGTGRLTMEPIMELRNGSVVSENPAKAAAFRREYGS